MALAEGETNGEINNTNGGSNLRRGSSLRLPPAASVGSAENELGTQLRRGGSLRIPRTRTEDRRTLVVDSASSLRVPRDKRLSSSSPLTNSSSSSSEVNGKNGGCERPVRPARRSASTLDQPAPEYLARNLLQLGCPVISMPTPRGGVGSEHPQSSDSDDSTATHSQNQGQGYGHGHSHGQFDSYTVPKVQVSGPPNPSESSSVVNGSAGSIGARSAPSTPLQSTTPGVPQTGQQSINPSQLTVVANIQVPQPPRSPSHAALRCNDR